MPLLDKHSSIKLKLHHLLHLLNHPYYLTPLSATESHLSFETLKFFAYTLKRKVPC